MSEQVSPGMPDKLPIQNSTSFSDKGFIRESPFPATPDMSTVKLAGLVDQFKSAQGDAGANNLNKLTPDNRDDFSDKGLIREAAFPKLDLDAFKRKKELPFFTDEQMAELRAKTIAEGDALKKVGEMVGTAAFNTVLAEILSQMASQEDKGVSATDKSTSPDSNQNHTA